MLELTLCLPYYDNPNMLAEHYRQWAAWPEALKARVEVVLVDDASPTSPAIDVPRPDGLPPLRIYRIAKNIRWGWHQARNLAAKKAAGKWLVLTDMDHAIEPDVIARLLANKPDPRVVWTFHRVDKQRHTSDLRNARPHFNSFAMTRDLFGKIGGYDEAFGELYSGKDGEFRRRCARLSKIQILPEGMRLVRWQWMIDDAATMGMVRKHPEDKKAAHALTRKLEADPGRVIKFLKFRWSRQL